MIDIEQERSLSNFVYRQFLISGSGNFLEFYTGYKEKFRIKSTALSSFCSKCEKIIVGKGIGFEVEDGEREKIKRFVHEGCLDEIMYSGW